MSLIYSAKILLTGSNYTLKTLISGVPITFFIDNLAAFFILLISLVSLSVSIYAFGYIKHQDSSIKRNFLASAMALFILAMILVVASKNLFSFLFFWELMSVSSFLLVMFDYKKEETKKAGIFYFVMTQLSTVFLLFSFMLIYSHTGNLEISSLTGLPSILIFVLYGALFIGFGIKAGVIPFHKWLPYAHPASPSLISAMMSGVMLKIAIYGLLRFFLILPEQHLYWGVIILFFGTISALFGIIYALKEHDLKRLLAYSSIENIGIILISFSLYLIFSSLGFMQYATIALIATLFHALNHALFKSLLFLNSGAIINATHTRDIEEMGGLIKKMPYSAVLFFIGAIAISALPPLNGFVSELMIFQVFFKSELIATPLIKVILYLALALLALTSGLSLACFTKVFGIIFLAVPRSKKAKVASEAPFSMLFAQGILAFLCIILGIFSFQILGFIANKLHVKLFLPNLLFITFFFFILLLIIFIVMRIFASKKVRVDETWGCGIYSQNKEMEYTATGFSEPIMTIFSAIYKTKKINKRLFFDHKNTIFKEGYAEIQLIKIFEEYFYLPIAKSAKTIALFIDNFQKNADLDNYLFYSFMTVIILIFIVGLLL
ncbi:MAG: proton-conducting transporter membrane subunit [Candidatus Margulisiibacteriota bacterium]